MYSIVRVWHLTKTAASQDQRKPTMLFPNCREGAIWFCAAVVFNILTLHRSRKSVYSILKCTVICHCSTCHSASQLSNNCALSALVIFILFVFIDTPWHIFCTKDCRSYGQKNVLACILQNPARCGRTSWYTSDVLHLFLCCCFFNLYLFKDPVNTFTQLLRHASTHQLHWS